MKPHQLETVSHELPQAVRHRISTNFQHLFTEDRQIRVKKYTDCSCKKLKKNRPHHKKRKILSSMKAEADSDLSKRRKSVRETSEKKVLYNISAC